MSDHGRIDLLGIGNAIVDVLAESSDEQIETLGLERGAMTLVDEDESERLYARMGPAHESSGGSAANTLAAFVSLGGRGAFIGRVRDDQLGRIFAHDIRAAGVQFETPPAREGAATARCLIFVTPDGQRTMQTFLGASVELGPEDVDDALVARAAITYLEGYLWDRPAAKEACLKAEQSCHGAGNRLALSLSDPFCVERWRSEFHKLVADKVDILFANESEIKSLYETTSFDDAAARVRKSVPLAVLTRSEKGSLILQGEEAFEVAAVPPARVLDTTGAGDLFAAGFLRALTAGLSLPQCGHLGSEAASLIIQQYGARSSHPLMPLYERVAGGARTVT